MELTQAIMDAAENEEDKKRILSIMQEGGYDNYTVNNASRLMSRDNPRLEARKRAGKAYLLARNPETFYEMLEDDICLFHGTDSRALPSILKNGLKSLYNLKKENIDIQTGEKSTMKFREMQNSSDFISFTDDIETVCEYADGSKDKSAFGVVIGMKKEAINNMRTVRVDSDCIEMGVKGQVPLEAISFIGVPQDKIKFVKKMVGNNDIKVMPMPLDPYEKFYMIDTSGFVDIFYDKLNSLVEHNNKKKKEFGISSYKALGEKIGINKMLDSLKDLLVAKRKYKNQKHGMMS